MGVGDGIEVKAANWRFRGEVVDKFDDHVAKSVPLYHEGHELVCSVSDYFVKDDSLCYDLGCSTGTLTLALAQHNTHKPGARFVGIDSEADMVARARDKQRDMGLESARFEVDDIVAAELEPCDLVTAYYTIQFVRPSVRQTITGSIRTIGIRLNINAGKTSCNPTSSSARNGIQ